MGHGVKYMSGQRSRASRGGTSDGGSAVVVRADGVRVAKALSDDAAAIPVIRYEIESTMDSAVAVSLRDSMPPGIDADDVGFHAEYEADRWQKTGDGVEFRCPLGPNDRVETVVGLRTASVPDPGAFATEPELTVLGGDAGRSNGGSPADSDDPADATGSTLSPPEEPADWERGMDLSDIERSFDGGAATTGGAPDDGGSEAADEGGDDEMPTLDLEDPAGPDSVGSTDAAAAPGPDDGQVADGTAASSDDAAPTPDTTDDGSDRPGDEPDDDGSASARRLDPEDDVVSALVAAFRDDRVDDADRELLRNELNLELADSTSSFVEHLQSRAKRKRDQLTEEIDGLEDSITDLYGLKADASSLSTVEDRVDELQETAAEAERVEALADSLRDLDDRAAEATELAAVADRLDDLADDAARADDLERVAEAARELEERKAAEEDVAALERSLESDIEGTRSDLEATERALDDRIDAVEEAAATVAELNELEGRLAKLRERVDGLEDRAADAEELADAERRLDTAVSTLAEEVESLDERTAAEADLEAMGETLQSDYVTEADVESVVESRLEQGVGRFLALAVGSGGLLSSATLAVTAGPAAAGVAAVLGLALLGVWWYLGSQRTDPDGVGV